MNSYCIDKNINYIEVSAKNDFNIDKIFDTVSENMKMQYEYYEDDSFFELRPIESKMENRSTSCSGC